MFAGNQAVLFKLKVRGPLCIMKFINSLTCGDLLSLTFDLFLFSVCQLAVINLGQSLVTIYAVSSRPEGFEVLEGLIKCVIYKIK